LTIAYHVLRNEGLATVDPRGAGAEGHWDVYRSGLTRWNHARAATALAASAMFIIAQWV
jgi:uncharacterized membrane protein